MHFEREPTTNLGTEMLVDFGNNSSLIRIGIIETVLFLMLST